MSSDFNVTDPIFARACEEPRAAAVISGKLSVDSATLCSAVSRAAADFDAAGWHAGDVIGVSLRGPVLPHIVASLALARIGAVQVALPPAEAPERREALARALGVKALVAESAPARLESLPRVAPDSRWLSADTTPPRDIRAAGGDSPWIVIQTSGTTATPKNIAIGHRVEQARAERLKPVACRPGERFVNLTELTFWMGISRMLRGVAAGGCYIDPPPAADAEAWLAWAEAERISYLLCAPHHIHNMVRKIEARAAPRMPWIRILRCSAAALPIPTLEEARKRLTPNIFTTYGTNEQDSLCGADPAILERYPDSVGRPWPGVELEVVDDADHPVPAGALGRVRVRGEGMVRALAPGASASAPAPSLGGWHYPGDSAVLNAEGILFLKGRTDDVMNFDGMLVGPAEIDAVLAAHPAVAEAAAFALPDPGHQEVPVAAVVLKQPIGMDALVRYCRDRLGARAPLRVFKMEALPRNAMGKVLRRRLTEMALARAKKTAAAKAAKKKRGAKS